MGPRSHALGPSIVEGEKTNRISSIGTSRHVGTFKKKLGISRFKRYLGPRYKTFLYAFEQFEAIGGHTVVELGTSRSFVSGGYKGVMVNDPRYWSPNRPSRWDWGGGLFTRMCPAHLGHLGIEFHSVDISPEALEISHVIPADYAGLVTHHLMDSERFLRTFPGKIDLLYMDAGETEAGAGQLHLAEAKLVVERKLISPRGIVLIDDANVPRMIASKGRLSIPYLREQGFGLVMLDYQAVLRAPENP